MFLFIVPSFPFSCLRICGGRTQTTSSRTGLPSNVGVFDFIVVVVRLEDDGCRWKQIFMFSLCIVFVRAANLSGES